MSKWFVGIGDQQVGPMSKEDLIYRFLSENISETSLVWRDGLDGWIELSKSELMPEAKRAREMKHAAAIKAQIEQGGTKMPAVPPKKKSIDVRYAGFWVRLLAYVVDTAFLSVIGVMVAKSLIPIFQAMTMVQELPPPWTPQIVAQMVTGIFNLLLSFFYYALIQAILGATFGKMICGLRLVKTDLKPVTIGKCILRYAMMIVSAIPLGFGFISIAWNPKKQGWHDRIAGTLVVPKDVAD